MLTWDFDHHQLLELIPERVAFTIPGLPGQFYWKYTFELCQTQDYQRPTIFQAETDRVDRSLTLIARHADPGMPKYIAAQLLDRSLRQDHPELYELLKDGFAQVDSETAAAKARPAEADANFIDPFEVKNVPVWDRLHNPFFRPTPRYLN